jgi:hypothetical protein
VLSYANRINYEFLVSGGLSLFTRRSKSMPSDLTGEFPQLATPDLGIKCDLSSYAKAHNGYFHLTGPTGEFHQLTPSATPTMSKSTLRSRQATGEIHQLTAGATPTVPKSILRPRQATGEIHQLAPATPAMSEATAEFPQLTMNFDRASEFRISHSPAFG